MLNRLRGLFGAELAVDLGTANTLISAPAEGLLLNEPSVVAVEQGAHRVLAGGCAVGHLAKQMQGRTPEGISVVRPLRDGVICDFLLCEAMLRYFLRKARRQTLGGVARAIISVPGCITPVEKRALLNSAGRAGARRVFLIAEAKAAAIGCGLPITEPVASMVCDVGGGTTEVAVMSLGETVASASIRVGGDAMDQAIVDYVRRHYSMRIGGAVAERLRIDIGGAFPKDDEQTDEVRGVDAVSGLPRKATITSEQVREAIAEPLEAILNAIKQTLDECGPDLGADLVDHGLVLAGGGSLLDGLDRYVAQHTGLPVRVAPNALSAVARGTQICLRRFSQWRPVLETEDDV